MSYAHFYTGRNCKELTSLKLDRSQCIKNGLDSFLKSGFLNAGSSFTVSIFDIVLNRFLQFCKNCKKMNDFLDTCIKLILKTKTIN